MSISQPPLGRTVLRLELDPQVFCLKAIKNAAYDFADRASIEILSDPSGATLVLLSPLPSCSPADEPLLPSLFRNAILDHQVRLEVGEDFKTIREMIVAQAFEPCDNLDEVVEALRP